MFERLDHPKTQYSIDDFIDLKMGSLGAAFMGATVYYINREYGFDAAGIAAAKQAAYTMLVGGGLMQLCKNLSRYYKDERISKAAGFLVPSALTIGLTYFVHTLKGTPEPWESTIPTVILGPPVFAYWSNKKREQMKNKIDQV